MDPPASRAPGTFRALALTPDTWPDLETLFGLPGGSIVRGCWCMFYRQTGRQPPGTDNKQELLGLVDAGIAPGLVGYLDDSPIGWISLGPREEYLKLRRSPIMKPVDDADVWSVVCSYIARPYRGLGLQHELLAAAINFARASGISTLEVYPIDKAVRSHDDFMFFGARSLYESAGFREVVRRSPTRVVMRLELASPARYQLKASYTTE